MIGDAAVTAEQAAAWERNLAVREAIGHLKAGNKPAATMRMQRGLMRQVRLLGLSANVRGTQ